MGKMEVEITSDNLKKQIIDFRNRDKQGLVERYDNSQLKKDLGGESLYTNLGVAKKTEEVEERPTIGGFNGRRNSGGRSYF